MMNRRHASPENCREGFTAIELLIVIGILAVLIALLLPAIQQVRESARRICCRNNLKQWGLAIHQYHDVHGTCPPASLTPNLHNLNELLLPFLEQHALYLQLDFSRKNLDAANVDVLANTVFPLQICPSNPREGAIGGYDGMPSQGAAYQTSAGAYRFPLGPDMSSDCYFLDNPSYCAGPRVTPTSGMFSLNIAAPNYACRFRDVTDGLGQTLMLGEVLPQLNLFHGLWSVQMYGFTTSMTPNSSRARYPATDTIPGVSYQDALNRNHGLFSAHPGGVHVLRGDGSVAFLNNSIHFETYNYLGMKADAGLLGDY